MKLTWRFFSKPSLTAVLRLLTLNSVFRIKKGTGSFRLSKLKRNGTFTSVFYPASSGSDFGGVFSARAIGFSQEVAR